MIKKLLVKMGYMNRYDRVLWDEIIFDVTFVSIVGFISYILAVLHA